jgi:6-phosphogluconolactonase
MSMPISIACLALLAIPVVAVCAQPQWVFVGTYTDGASEGIYRLSFDPQTGKLSEPQLAAKLENPTFLVVAPNKKSLYSTRELGNDKPAKTGFVHAFGLDAATGKLTPLNFEPTGGPGPCQVALDRDGCHLMTANYADGSVAVFPVDKSGKLQPNSALVRHEGSGPNTERQKKAYAHSIKVDPTGKFALAADLGCDKLFVYRLDQQRGTLTETDATIDLPAGSGPRHFVFYPNGKFAYVLNELLNTVAVFSYDGSQGKLEPLQTISTLPDDFTGENTSAEIVVHPSGKFLYTSNRGHDSIATFAIDATTGKLTARGHTATEGKTPRNFALDATGKWLLVGNERSDSLVVFALSDDGTLKPTGEKAAVPNPACVLVVPQ